LARHKHKMSATCFPPGEKPKRVTQFQRFDDIMKQHSRRLKQLDHLLKAA